MLITKFLNPKNDYAFKRIFGRVQNKDILIHFINDILGLSGKSCIEDVTFLKTNQDPDIAATKQSSVDVMCTDELRRQYIVEMQVVKGRGFEKRAQYYAAKAYSRQLMESEQYFNLKEVIFIAITNFIMFPGKDAYKSDHIILDKETYEHDLKDFSFTFIELPKFKLQINQLSSMIEKWTYFFKHAEDTDELELAKIIGSDLIIKRAYDELNRFYWSEIDLNTYEQQEKYELDAIAIRDQQLEDGRIAGREEGRLEAEVKALAQKIKDRRAIIQKMLKLGLNEDIIAETLNIGHEEFALILAQHVD